MLGATASRVANPAGVEEIIEPDLPIVDAHHHLWFQPPARLDTMERAESPLMRKLLPTYKRHARYLFDEFATDVQCGHNVVASVFIDSNLMYRADGPEHLRSVGEIEFVNGVAAMSASGNFGPGRLCAGIVGRVDLTLGDQIEEVLEEHIRAGGRRYKGVRWHVAHDPDPAICPLGADPQILGDSGFRAGFRRLRDFGLSFEAFVLEPQLMELVDLARACPDSRIILNHVGGPVGMGRYSGLREQRFPIWRQAIRVLSDCPNVRVKLGGLGMPQPGFVYASSQGDVTAADLAREWRPYIETCIEAFGAERCMFESNFPLDSMTCSYSTVWNAFKLITGGASRDERAALFSGTAIDTYGLHDLSEPR